MSEACTKLAAEFEYYSQRIAPVYSYLVALKGQKPLQVLVEIENTFAHMAQACQGKQVKENIERAHNHLHRLETDLYKLLFVELLNKLKDNRINDNQFVNLARDAREAELKSIGSNDHRKVISAYHSAVNKGLTALGLDPLDVTITSSK